MIRYGEGRREGMGYWEGEGEREGGRGRERGREREGVGLIEREGEELRRGEEIHVARCACEEDGWWGHGGKQQFFGQGLTGHKTIRKTTSR